MRKRHVKTMRTVSTIAVVKRFVMLCYFPLRSAPFPEKRRVQLATIYCIRYNGILVAVSIIKQRGGCQSRKTSASP